MCLDGKGNAPTEEMGGEMDYEEFLENMADKSHLEYEEMKGWSEMQGYEVFDLEKIKELMKDVRE